MNLDEMPLDGGPDQVQRAWHLVTGMDWRRHKATAEGKPPDPFLPGEYELGRAMERIQAAAVSHGMGRFPDPAWRARQEPS